MNNLFILFFSPKPRSDVRIWYIENGLLRGWFSVAAHAWRSIYRSTWLSMESTRSALSFQTLKVEKGHVPVRPPQ